MDQPVRSLRELFSSLSGGHSGAESDPAAMLAEHGHGDLPGDLVAEAIVNYADTAPVEVAEHLSSYVMAHSAVPGVDPGPEHLDGAAADGLALLTSAPEPAPLADGHHDVTDTPDAVHQVAPDLHVHDAPQHVVHDAPVDLGFGHGHDQAVATDAPTTDAGHETHDAPGTQPTDWTLADPHHLVDAGTDVSAPEHSWAPEGDHTAGHHVDVTDDHGGAGLDLGGAG